VLGVIARESGRRFGDRAVLVTPTDRLTYAELDRDADALAAGLRRRGLQRGDVVAAVLPSGPEWMVLAVALDRVGAVLATVSATLAVPERGALVSLVRPALVVAGPTLVDGLPLRADVAVIAAGGRGAELAAGADGTDGTDDGTGDGVPDDDRRVTTICFTSGTTGRAKGAVFTVAHQRAVQALDLGEGAEAVWGGGSPMLASTQFAHVGMVLKLPWYLRLGATLHVLDPWRADDALRAVAEHRMPTIGVVAPQLALMLRSPLMDTLDLSSVTTIIAGGAASPPALVQEARRRFGAAYSIRYSSTESGGVGLGTAFDAPDGEALSTSGRPRTGIEARVTDADDAPLPAGEVGELQLRSPAVMAGYWNDPTATAAALTPDGWLRTGDLARVDTAGCFVLSGRRTEMYIRGGYNVFPTEVEAVLADHPAVASVAVAPRPDDVMGEVGVAVVVPVDPMHPPTVGSLRDHAAERLARHKLPEDVVVVDRIPLTTVSKVDRAALADLVRHDEGSSHG
jgi:acyl-CoA synthetase (AMP-forming)/AMP-acid ligase II